MLATSVPSEAMMQVAYQLVAGERRFLAAQEAGFNTIPAIVRPLTERMETYARNDTHYLKPLSDKLKLELQQKGRLAGRPLFWIEMSANQSLKDFCSMNSRMTSMRFIWIFS